MNKKLTNVWYKENKYKTVAILVLSTLGLLLSLYLWRVHQSGRPTICNSGCDSVIHSEYGVMMGVPMGAMGVAFYFGIGLFAYLRLEIKDKLLENIYKIVLGVGLFFTIYLRYIEFVYLKEFCILCWGSVLLVLLLTWLEVASMPRRIKQK